MVNRRTLSSVTRAQNTLNSVIPPSRTHSTRDIKKFMGDRPASFTEPNVSKRLQQSVIVLQERGSLQHARGRRSKGLSIQYVTSWHRTRSKTAIMSRTAQFRNTLPTLLYDQDTVLSKVSFWSTRRQIRPLYCTMLVQKGTVPAEA